MKTSILICATCFIVTGCTAQLRFPSLSSALSSLTGFGGGSSGGGSGSSAGQSSSQSSSPYSGLVRDYGRNLMMAMSSIYPTLFKPPQPQQQQQAPPNQQQVSPQASPYDQFSSGGSQGGLFSSQSAPSFSFGGSTFSISPSLPFGSLTGASSQQATQQQSAQGPHSPFSASFGSSINSPSSFGPLSSSPFLQQSMPSFAPPSSYNAAFEAANGGPAPIGGSFGGQGLNSASVGAAGGQPSASSLHSAGQLMSQSSQSNSINSYAPLPSYQSQHDSSAPMLGQSSHHSPTGAIPQAASHSAYGAGPQQNQAPGQQQYSSQQYRPDMMSIAASAPVPSSNSYSNYGNIPSSPSQQVPVSSSSYQQPSYR